MIRTPDNDAWLSFRLPSENRDLLDKFASTQQRSRSDLLREVVEIVVADFTWEARTERSQCTPTDRS